MTRRLRALVFSLGALIVSAAITSIGPGSAYAEGPSLVTVVRSPRPRTMFDEATMRLAAELRAAGFLVRVIDAAPGLDGRGQVEVSARSGEQERGAARTAEASFATIAILETARGAAADVWVADHLTQKTLVRRVEIGDAGSPTAASDLAVRSVELLRASLLEVKTSNGPAPPLPADLARWLDRPAPLPQPLRTTLPVESARRFDPESLSGAAPPALPPAPYPTPFGAAVPGPGTIIEGESSRAPPSATAPTSSYPSPSPGPARAGPVSGAPEPTETVPGVFRVEAAFGVLAGRFGITPQPLLRLGVRLPLNLSLRGAVAPPLFESTLSAAEGSVAVRQTAVALDLAYTLPFDRVGLYPLLAVGASVYHLRVDGTASAPYVGEHHDFSAPMLVAGAGLGVRLTKSLMARAELDLLVPVSEPVVTIAGNAVGSAGIPAFLPSAGLAASF